MAGNVLIKNANGNTVTLQNPDTNVADVVVDTSNIASKQYVDDADALKVALSSFTGINRSLVNNGYQKLPGGLIIQWGRVAAPAAGVVSATFPITFPNACLNAVATIYDTTIPNQSLALHIVNFSASSIGVSKLYTNNGGAVGEANQGWIYFAIGY